MATYQANDIIYIAARLAGILGAPGRQLSQSEASDCLRALNDLLDAWNVDPLMIFTQVIYIFSLTPNTQIYQMGPGVAPPGFDVPRPDYISHANIITQIAGGQPVRTPMDILTDDGWSAIQVQATGSAIPQGLYNDGASPISNLYFWPYPNAAAQVEIYAWNPATQFTALTDAFQMPSGYRKAVEYNLAVDLVGLFPGLKVSPTVAQIARETRFEVQAHNSTPPVMSCDDALLSAKKSSWSYLTGLPN